MNMQHLMAQAKKIQSEVTKATAEIEATIFNFENNYLLIEGKGDNKITKITIKDKSILEDSEMLEDLITVGVNDILDQISDEKEKKLGKYTGGMGGLF